jgi:predicted DNA-binding protein
MYALYIVKRTQIYLEDSQDQLLEQRAQDIGTTKSAVIREAIDAFLDEPAGTAETALQRFRSAIAQAAGVASHLPSGHDYVEAVRAADRERDDELRARRR